MVKLSSIYSLFPTYGLVIVILAPNNCFFEFSGKLAMIVYMDLVLRANSGI